MWLKVGLCRFEFVKKEGGWVDAQEERRKLSVHHFNLTEHFYAHAHPAF